MDNQVTEEILGGKEPKYYYIRLLSFETVIKDYYLLVSPH